LEKALLEFGEGEITVTGAGRTDAGVHALNQAAHFDLLKEVEPNSIVSALNAKTASEILIRTAEIAAPAFHARYDAVWRKYLYIISKNPTAIGRRYSWHPSFDYNFKLLQAQAAEVMGERNFAAFCKSKSLKENTVCTISYAAWTENAGQRIFEIVGDRFLHQMVRLMVGTMLDVARGRFEPDAIEGILESGDVSRCGTSAPAQGLFLAEVGY